MTLRAQSLSLAEATLTSDLAGGCHSTRNTDVGSGARGFTIYDPEADRKVVEFHTVFPHVSPDGRYLVYRKFMSRANAVRPQVKVIDLDRDLASLDVCG